LPGIGWCCGFFGEIHDILAKGRAVQCSCEQTDCHGKPVSLRAANRKQKALRLAGRIGQGFALPIHHPALRHRFPPLGEHLDLAGRGIGRGHIENEWR